MTSTIDIDALARRESEQVEWKENVADTDDVVATICAFANDLLNLGGGYVVCGAREAVDENGFQKLVRTGLTSARLKEVEGVVLATCRERVTPPITPLVDELPAEDANRRLIVFTVPATRYAHVFRRRSEAAAHHVRIGRTTREARNGILLQLLSAKGQVEPWDHQACAGAAVKDLDLLAIRDALVRFGLPDAPSDVQALLSHERALSPFVPPLCAKEPLTGVLRPRNFAILLFGRNPQIFVPGATSSISTYPGTDRSEPVASRNELAGTVIEQIQGIWAILRAQGAMMFDKENPEHPNLHVYPERALQEALVNAFAHRDYTSPQPTAVTIFEDRVEILSPGPLPLGVSLLALRRGRLSPHWRNRGLAWFFRRLELAQAEGQGVALIRKLMKLEGCPPPRFDATEADVMCTLRANPRALEIRRRLGSTFRTAAPEKPRKRGSRRA